MKAQGAMIFVQLCTWSLIFVSPLVANVLELMRKLVTQACYGSLLGVCGGRRGYRIPGRVRRDACRQHETNRTIRIMLGGLRVAGREECSCTNKFLEGLVPGIPDAVD